MLDIIISTGRRLMSWGWVISVVLIIVTVVLGTYGFRNEVTVDIKQQPAQEGSKQLEAHQRTKLNSWSDAAYKAAALLAIQTGNVNAGDNTLLEVARWTGMAFFASALVTVLIQLFRDPLYRWLVRSLADHHVIVAGLGDHGIRLVETLRQKGHTVVVIEGNKHHPAVQQCESCGAIVLWGEPGSEKMLTTAAITRAKAVLALFNEERECVRITTTAYSLLQQRDSSQAPVNCVMQLMEPGLLDVMRSHRIKTDPNDRFHLEILNSHEIAATSMVREARTQCRTGRFQKLMICSLGTFHRLGEMVILRAIKDHLVLDEAAGKLQIDVYDKDADDWLKSFLTRYPYVSQHCQIQPQRCWARKIGGHGLSNEYDAAFVCVGDEGAGTSIATTLRRQCLSEERPIMVAVQQSDKGFGRWLDFSNSGWGSNVHAIGMEDSLYDSHMALQPELEMRAQAIHTNFRLKLQRDMQQCTSEDKRLELLQQRANRPWNLLDDAVRQDNRENARQYDNYMAEVNAVKRIKYRRVFSPDWMVIRQTRQMTEMTADEVDSLAAREHERWLQRKQNEGWTYAATRNDNRKQSPFIQPYDKLSEEQKDHNRVFIRNIPRVLALADYRIEPDHTPPQ
jgi:hypothetical protein